MTTITEQASQVSFLWLELTGRCGLACAHCYNSSGPAGTHGTMTGDDWLSVLAQAADLGVSMVQFIGGEPTLHPEFAALLAHAVGAGLAAEVYSNLTHVRESWWELFACPQVSLATSYYSDDPAEHDAITGRRGSHSRTRANITEAVARGIPIRAAVIGMREGQRTGQARAELEAIGVTRIGTDRLRYLGRAASAGPYASELCGNCGRGIAAVLPSGDVTPCVMARWLTAGNVRDTSLAAILSGPAMAAATAVIPARSGICHPDCDSDICRPEGGKPGLASDTRPPPAGSACAPDCAPASDSDICPPPGRLPCSPSRKERPGE